MPPLPLSDAELALWHAWKRASEAVMARVAKDIADATGLSGADYGVLSRLVDLGDGELRQQELAESMRWHKSRLSHQVTRMTERGLVDRRALGKTGALIVITPAGRKVLGLARPVHARSVRQHLLDKLTGPERTQVRELLERLASGD